MSSPSDADTSPVPDPRPPAGGSAPAGGPQQPPAGRYPTSRATGRALAIILGVGLIALLVAVAFLAYRLFTDDAVSGETVSYEVVGDNAIDVQILVTRDDPSQPVSCVVRARSRDGSETGRREVLIRPTEGKTVELTTRIATSAPPGMADLYGCGDTVPAYLTKTS